MVPEIQPSENLGLVILVRIMPWPVLLEMRNSKGMSEKFQTQTLHDCKENVKMLLF